MSDMNFNDANEINLTLKINDINAFSTDLISIHLTAKNYDYIRGSEA